MSRGRYRTDDNVDLLARLTQMEERLSRLERIPRIGATAIDRGDLTILEGSLVVIDDEGNPRVRVGKLDDGTYDLTAYSADGSQTVNLAAIAFGQKTDFVATQVNVNLTANHKTTFVDLSGSPGPTCVDVLVGSSGRCKVTISAQMNYSTQTFGNNVGGAMSFAVSGATTVAANDDNSIRSRLWNVVPGGGGVGVQQIFKASYQVLLTGLTPGLHTFTAKYKDLGSVADTNGCNFEDRRLWVEPL